MKARTLLLTGCDGFIGRHIAETAQAQGWQVVGVSRSLDGPAPVAKRLRLDLRDADAEERLRAAMVGAHAVVHAAARVQLFGPPAPVIAENVAVTARVLRAAASAGHPRLVFLSSASVLFARREQLDLKEDAQLPERCLNGYAESKKLCEALVEDYAGSSAILRPQAVIGPGDRTLLPPVLHAAQRRSWRWIGQANAAGTDLASVGNLAEYCVRAAEQGDATGVFHISDGECVPIEQLFRQVFRALDIHVSDRRMPRIAAKLAARTCEWPLRWLAPHREPPLTEFAVEVLTRTRTLNRARTLAHLGPPASALQAGLDAAIASLRDRRRDALRQAHPVTP